MQRREGWRPVHTGSHAAIAGHGAANDICQFGAAGSDTGTLAPVRSLHGAGLESAGAKPGDHIGAGGPETPTASHVCEAGKHCAGTATGEQRPCAQRVYTAKRARVRARKRNRTRAKQTIGGRPWATPAKDGHPSGAKSRAKPSGGGNRGSSPLGQKAQRVRLRWRAMRGRVDIWCNCVSS